MRKHLLIKTMLLLLALIAGSGSAWAESKPWSCDDPTTTMDLQTITSSTMGTWNGAISWYLDDDYLIVTGYESYKSVGNQTWITQSSVGNSGSSWDASSPFKGSSYYTTANYATLQSGRALVYKVTNLKSLKVYGKNNSTSKYLDIFIYTKSGSNYTKVEEIKYTTDNSEHIWENSTTLSTSETYFIYITGVGSSNSRVFEVAFERNSNSTKHTLSSAVTPVGSGTVTLGATSISEGSTTTITATPEDGYRFVGWSCSGTGSSVADEESASTTFTMGTADATVTAEFEEIPTYTLSYAVSPEGAGTVALGASTVREGSTTTATATANDGYKFKNWSITGTGASLSSTTDNPTTITMGTANATVIAEFEAVTTYAISWSVNDKVIRTDNVEENTVISFPTTIEGIPTGYVLKGWVVESNKITGTQNTAPTYVTEATSTADITYYAVMAIETSTVATATLTATHTTNTTDYSTHTYTDDQGYSWSARNGEPYDDKNGARYNINKTSGNHFESPTFPSDVTSIKILAYNGSSSATRTFYICSASDKTTGDLGSISVSPSEKLANELTATLGNTSFKKFYLKASDALGFRYIKVSYGSTTISNYCTTVPTLTKNVTAAGWATYAPEYPVAFGSEEAYIINSASTSGTTLTEVSSVPAGTPVLLKGVGNHTLTVVASSTTDVSDNCLKVSNGTAKDGIYVLADGTYGVGFYLWTGSSALTEGKIYMQIPSPSRSFISLPDETNGIDALLTKSEEVKTEVFNLSGQRVAQPTKGLYIINGKKVIVK